MGPSWSQQHPTAGLLFWHVWAQKPLWDHPGPAFNYSSFTDNYYRKTPKCGAQCGVLGVGASYSRRGSDAYTDLPHKRGCALKLAWMVIYILQPLTEITKSKITDTLWGRRILAQAASFQGPPSWWCLFWRFSSYCDLQPAWDYVCKTSI